MSLHTCHSFIYRVTFYLVDANQQISMQIYKEVLNPPLRDTYNVCDLCEKLEPLSSSIGLYQMIKAQPPVYMYTYAKTEQASKAKLDDFFVTRLYVRSDEILQPCQPVMQIQFNLKAFRLFDADNVVGLFECSRKLMKMLREKVSLPRQLVDDTIKHSDRLETFFKEDKFAVKEQQEVAINAKFTNLLQYSIFPEPDFKVRPFSKEMSHKVCKYAASHQDIVIYH